MHQRHFSRTDTVGAYHSGFRLAYQRARILPKKAKADRTSETPWVANSCRELLGHTMTLVSEWSNRRVRSEMSFE